MTEREALLAAVVADPDADLPRLVYADWCDQNGDPARAEFIRVQCALATRPVDQVVAARQVELLGLPVDGPLAVATATTAEDRALVAREAELLRLHEDRWRAELPRPGWMDGELSGWNEFTRGFISEHKITDKNRVYVDFGQL